MASRASSAVALAALALGVWRLTVSTLSPSFALNEGALPRQGSWRRADVGRPSSPPPQHLPLRLAGAEVALPPALWPAAAGGQRARALVPRRARFDGPFGVLPETASPIIDTTEEEDPIWERLVMIVQSADQKRGIDMTAFWTSAGWDVVVIISALSRPQLQAIAQTIELNMRKKLRLKQIKASRIKAPAYDRDSRLARPNSLIRIQAASGWVCLAYQRITVHVMTPVQRAYFDIEGIARDKNQDYEQIDLAVLLKEDTFGNLKLKKEIDNGENAAEDDDSDGPVEEDNYPRSEYEEDEEDPFWS